MRIRRFARSGCGAYASTVARVHDDDRPTVDLGPRTPEDDYDPADSLPGDSYDDEPIDPPTAQVVEPSQTIKAPPDPLHTLPTQQLVPRSKRPSSSSLTKISNTSTTASPVAAMRHDEWERSRVFIRAVLAICFGGVIVALTSAGDPAARTILLV